MKTILFMGDPITDAGRDRENLCDLGKGYPALVAARLGLDAPGRYRFLNVGAGDPASAYEKADHRTKGCKQRIAQPLVEAGKLQLTLPDTIF